MLENEPSSGADGTAGTTERPEHDQITTSAPPQDAEVRITSPSKRGGAVRSAGPPPEPEPVDAEPTGPVTTIAGSGAPDSVSVSSGRTPQLSRATETPTAPGEEPEEAAEPTDDAEGGASFQPPMVLFQPPVAAPANAWANGSTGPTGAAETTGKDTVGGSAGTVSSADDAEDDQESLDDDRSSRRRRRRGGRGRGRTRGEDESAPEAGQGTGQQTNASADAGTHTDTAAKKDQGAGRASGPGTEGATETDGSRRRRRRRRRTAGDTPGETPEQDDPPNTVVRVRESRASADTAGTAGTGEKVAEEEVQAVKGSTRLEAKKQRRREGREQGRRRAPIVTESEFLARRESVKRDLVIRRAGERTQIAVLEDDVLVEHYVDRATHKSYVGNVYLGRVQNVLPSMEAAFVDIGKGRNAVLYAGEVNWDALGLEGQPRRIETALKSGQSVLVQVTKDPMGHKGARLTSQISLPGRYLVYVPDGSMTGISRKLPDKERARLKQILKKVMPENAGVIVRTAAEGASEEELERDISRLAAQWESIRKKSRSASAPSLLSSEPDLTVRVVRDVFNEDFSSLVVAGDEAWDTVKEYVDYVAPHLAERLSHWDGERDVFDAYRVDEQISKALERKVWLPSGGSLIFDRTEAMTVVDVNTGKFTGQGGNLEETVTKNNLEAAEEIVRQLRLRDIGGIIVVDFIDMVLESNRDLVLRRMLECLARDRTKHQVAEVTSLGLVQMTRKRVGQGLLEAFSHTCEHCNGRGLLVSNELTEAKSAGNGRKRKTKATVAGSTTDQDVEEKGGASPTAAEPAEESDRSVRAEQPGKDEKPAKTASKGTRKAASKRTSTRSRKAAPAEEPTTEPAAGEPADTQASLGAAGSGAEEPAEAESSGERPRKRRARRTKAAGTTSESAVAEAG